MKRRALIALVMAVAMVSPVYVPWTVADVRGEDPEARLASQSDNQEWEDVDAPDTCADVTTRTQDGGWIKGALTSATDVDWYRFWASTHQWTETTLAHLPKDYKLETTRDCSAPPGSFDNPGRQFERTIFRGYGSDFSYYVRVSSPHGRFSERPYWLMSRRYGNDAVLLSRRSWVNGDRLEIVAEVMNNTEYVREQMPVTVRLYDAANELLGDPITIYTALYRLAPWRRSPVRASVPLPAGYDHASFKAASGRKLGRMDLKRQRLVVAPGIPFVTDTGTRHYPGTVSNLHAFALATSQVTVTLYNALGRAVGSCSTYPGAISAHGSVEFDCVATDYIRHVNRFAFAVEASPG